MNKETFRIKLEVKTPLFIGSGIKYNRIDYINDFKNRKIYILDQEKWIDFLSKRKALDLFIEYLEAKANRVDIYEFLEKNNRIFRIQNLSFFFPSISSHTLSISHLDKMNNNDIDAFIKGFDGKPYIPGSSIKGAISNAIQKSLFTEDTVNSKKIVGLVNELPANKKYATRDFNNLLKEKTGPGMVGLQISDSTSFPLENLKIYRKIDVAPKTTKDPNPGEKVNQRSIIPLFRECADVGTQVEFNIGLDYAKLNSSYRIKGIDDLLDIINNSFDSLYGNNGVLAAYELINQFLPVNDSKQTLIQLGGGAGFQSKTLISGLALPVKEKNELTAKILHVRYRQHKHDKGVRVISPRCLKVVDYQKKKKIMGICQLSKLEDKK